MSIAEAFRLCLAIFAAVALTSVAHGQSQAPSTPPSIHIVYMGANDCPPCAAWRSSELPKLEQSPEFSAIKFSYVIKLIDSPVPPRFLPAEVKPYKDKLDAASSGRHGSPQIAVLVNEEVFDYIQGTRSAAEIERMIFAIRTGEQYPFERCVKASKKWMKCDVRG